DTGATGVLVVCADAQRRAEQLRGRTGGFALISHETLAEEPYLAEGFAHIVVLDPPLGRDQVAAYKVGSGFAYLAWGAAEVRFSQQMHEREYGLRDQLVALYRSLRERGRVAGEELEHLLRGDGSQRRSARLAGRLLRVFTELELVSLDPELPALALAAAQPTELERSAAFQAYSEVYEEGKRYLRAATPNR
ncbi:MAG: hypothetical protein J2O48_11160, partial [Solirubrobacterales bacterium]|nr:hypothetical protein [Solirubrobacterales bacterium]